ncbi:glycosyltransferase [Spirulina major]|uniref:glycosyltransferase n=1 Tax=Spirulina major TaxID=270636 RepID=UPI000934F35C|nr:glycosyltransferase [Spirulina major]
MRRYYLFYVRETLPMSGAYLVQMVHLANAAANLGYRAVLVYPRPTRRVWRWVAGFHPQGAAADLRAYYQLQADLQTAELAVLRGGDRLPGLLGKLTNRSTVVCKYHLPLHLRQQTGLVHSRDWNFVKAAIQQGIPAIYERDHCETKRYEPEIVQSPLLHATVTVATPVRDNLIANGMPPEKIRQFHNGFNRGFYERHPDQAQAWRDRLLTADQSLVVYAGALEPFKGIDIILDIAPQFPDVQFALAGGPPTQIAHYEAELKTRHLTNVSLLGYLSHDRLAPLLQAADILVYPHHAGNAANFTSPMKLFDYIAAGRNIISTTIPPLREFQTSPLITAWAEPDNPQDFALQLRKTLTTQPAWTPQGLYPWNAVQSYSWEARIEKTLHGLDPACLQALRSGQ